MVGISADRVPEFGYRQTASLPDVLRAIELAHSAPAEALALAESVLTPASRRTEPGTRGLAELLRGSLLAEQGRFHTSMASLRDAANDLRLAGLETEVLRADILLVQVLRDMGDSRQSVELAEELLRQRKAGSEPASVDTADDLIARLQSELALSLVKLGNFDEALYRLDHAWNRFRAIDDPYLVAVTERGRAIAYHGLGLMHRALFELDRVKESFERLGRPLDVARCTILIGESMAHLDRGAEAIKLLESVRPYLEHHGARPDLARLGHVLGRTLLSVGLISDARAEFVDAMDLYMDLGMVDDAGLAHEESALALLMMGDRKGAEHELDLADRLLFNSGNRELGVAALLLRSTVAWFGADLDRSVRLAEQSLELIDSSGGGVSPGFHVSALLLCAHDERDLEQARSRYETAQRMVSELGLTSMLINCAVSEAVLLSNEGVSEVAVANLRSALRAHSGGGFKQYVSQSTTMPRMAQALAFDTLLRLLIAQDTPSALAEAWRWTSVSKASMSDDFVAAILRHRGAQEPEVAAALSQSADVEPELMELSEQLDRLGDPDSARSGTEASNAQVAARRALRRRPEHSAQPVTVLLPDVDAPIPEGPLLQFHVLGDDLVIMVIREGQVYARLVEGAAVRSQRLLSQWWIECSQQARLGAGPRSSTGQPTSLSELGSLLIDPVYELLADLPSGAPLAIVGHQYLEEVPFEALHFEQEPMSSRFDLHFAVGLDPGTLGQISPTAGDEAQREQRERVLVLAVPDANAPEIATEAEGIAKIHPEASVVVGAQATTRLLAERGREFEIVHLSCHGIFDDVHARGSGLRLGDRWLIAGEIVDLDLRGVTIVLNACATGRVAKSGSDMGGLVWSFLAAGCAGVVSATWSVDDAVATEFGLQFHRAIADGMAPANAVAAARAEVRKTHPHPWHWAAFRYTSAADLVLHA